MKDLLNIIKDSEKLPYNDYLWKSSKHEPTDSYFYLARHIAKYIMRARGLNSHIDPVRTETTGMPYIPISYICDLDKS